MTKTDEAQNLAQQARQAEDRGDSERAEVLLTAAVNRNPQDCETRLELSDLLMQHGSLPAAITHLKRLVAENPGDPRSFVRLAQAMYFERQYHDASRYLDVALEMDPQNTQGLLLRGQLAELRHQDDAALETYFRVMQCDPENIEVQLRVAAIHLRRAKPESAAPLLRSVLESRHGCPLQESSASWMLGQAYGQEGRWTDAAAQLTVASRSRMMLAEDWHQVAYARYKAGDRAGAHQAIAQAVRLSPQDADIVALQRTLDPAVLAAGGTEPATSTN